VNNAKILCVENERCNTFFGKITKSSISSAALRHGQMLIFSWECAARVGGPRRFVGIPPSQIGYSVSPIRRCGGRSPALGAASAETRAQAQVGQNRSASATCDTVGRASCLGPLLPAALARFFFQVGEGFRVLDVRALTRARRKSFSIGEKWPLWCLLSEYDATGRLSMALRLRSLCRTRGFQLSATDRCERTMRGARLGRIPGVSCRRRYPHFPGQAHRARLALGCNSSPEPGAFPFSGSDTRASRWMDIRACTGILPSSLSRRRCVEFAGDFSHTGCRLAHPRRDLGTAEVFVRPGL